MTFAQGVLRLVRVGARVDLERVPGPASAVLANVAAIESATSVERPAEAAAVEPDGSLELGAQAFAVELFASDDLAGGQAAAMSRLEPGFSDIEAAVALVESGLATRVVLTGFPSWPGLLWQAYQLADASNVMILPTVVRPGGRVDIVIARDARTDG